MMRSVAENIACPSCLPVGDYFLIIAIASAFRKSNVKTVAPYDTRVGFLRGGLPRLLTIDGNAQAFQRFPLKSSGKPFDIYSSRLKKLLKTFDLMKQSKENRNVHRHVRDCPSDDYSGLVGPSGSCFRIEWPSGRFSRPVFIFRTSCSGNLVLEFHQAFVMGQRIRRRVISSSGEGVTTSKDLKTFP